MIYRQIVSMTSFVIEGGRFPNGQKSQRDKEVVYASADDGTFWRYDDWEKAWAHVPMLPPREG